jgi:signal transduction histidine kinase
MASLLEEMDPRRSLMAATIWLVMALAVSFAVAASYWAGSVAQEIVVQQHMRRLALETDQLASDLGQAVAARLDAVRAVGALVPLRQAFEHLASAYPELHWIALADPSGHLIAGDAAALGSGSAEWVRSGLKAPWLGSLRQVASAGPLPLLGDLAIPIRGSDGVAGVIAAHLTWHWASHDAQRLSRGLDARGSADATVLDSTGVVLVGAADLLGKLWPGIAGGESGEAAHLERLPDGSTALVARAGIRLPESLPQLSWAVQLSEPKVEAYQRASALGLRILFISITLAAITAAAGALAARHLTGRLKRLTRSAAAIGRAADGRNESAGIEVPTGQDEVAQLGRAFAKVLDDLRQERRDLLALSGDLERRVAVRTREVERLAEESRYSAVVRERLKIARDLHDTLAHSMMAMLSEVRLLRKLQAHDPAALTEELARAETVAHEGLIEARSAISQMRVNAVRDTGLGTALQRALDRFADRTGMSVEFACDPEAARFGDERAETLFRMAEEVLRNVEHHASASSVSVRLSDGADSELQLRIADNGIGFDPSQTRPGHFGLVGLREQAQLIGARLKIDSDGGGTTVHMALRTAPERL